MKLIPEYHPVEKLCLSFVNDFFHTRFKYGKTICDIVKAVQHHTAIELWVQSQDIVHLNSICNENKTNLHNVTLIHDSPGRAIIAEYAPIFALDDHGRRTGLIFNNPNFDNSDALQEFSKRFVTRLGFQTESLSFGFSTAQMLVNEDLILISEDMLPEKARKDVMRELTALFPSHNLHFVTALADDSTGDLDMYLWPVAPKTWIMSEYPECSSQADSLKPARKILETYGHQIYPVPGLPRLMFDDVNTMPNYTNGVLLNKIALVPAYDREEDSAVTAILQTLGFQVYPIDCSMIIQSNSGLHCISRTVPGRCGGDE